MLALPYLDKGGAGTLHYTKEMLLVFDAWKMQKVITPIGIKSNGVFFLPLRLSCKESSTFSPSPSSSGSGDVTALRCSEPLRSKVGGPSKVFARLCGMGPPYYSLLIGNAWDGLLVGTSRMVPHCSIALHLSPLEWGILVFILLLIGLLRERCPSGLWRKSYDRHWHLMNDHNDIVYHLW